MSSAPPATKDQNEVLHNIAQLNVEELANAGSGDGSGTSKSISPLGKAVSKEQERDWTQKVQDIINKFKSKAQNEGRGVTTPGDVTEHAIEQSLESAIKNAKLSTFETFLGENWSGERLRVMVLDRVEGDIDSLFRGNTRGYAPMQEVDSLIQRAAVPAARGNADLLRQLGAACAALDRKGEARAWYKLALGFNVLDSEAQQALFRLNEPGSSDQPTSHTAPTP